MSYVPENLRLAFAPVGDPVPRCFVYTTESDADAAIVGAGYFSDGVTKGMRVGDVVDVVATTGPKYKRYQVASVSDEAATVAVPTAIT